MFSLSKRSEAELAGVHLDVAAVPRLAITRTKLDFAVTDGLRTVAEQTEYVRTGVSRTMRSKHLKQADGFGHAFDLVPYVNGKIRWELEPLCTICQVVRQAADDLGVHLRWGGAWVSLFGTTLDPAVMVERYVIRRQSVGVHPFVDAPHYEWYQ